LKNNGHSVEHYVFITVHRPNKNSIKILNCRKITCKAKRLTGVGRRITEYRQPGGAGMGMGII